MHPVDLRLGPVVYDWLRYTLFTFDFARFGLHLLLVQLILQFAHLRLLDFTRLICYVGLIPRLLRWLFTFDTRYAFVVAFDFGLILLRCVTLRGYTLHARFTLVAGYAAQLLFTVTLHSCLRRTFYVDLRLHSRCAGWFTVDFLVTFYTHGLVVLITVVTVGYFAPGVTFTLHVLRVYVAGLVTFRVYRLHAVATFTRG